MQAAAGHRELRHVVIPEFVFGDGARRLVPHFLRNLGAGRVLLVTDPGVVQSGWTGEVVADLEASGTSAVVFTDVCANPRDDQVMAGAELYAQEGCTAIVAVGGGSPIDCAKGIGIVASSRRHILEFAGVDVVDVAMPPLVCVSTTTTSADISQFAVITNGVDGTKLAIVSKAIVPDVSLLDPVVYSTLSPEMTAVCGFDSLGQAIEAYLSNAHSPFTDLLALDGVRSISRSLKPAITHPADLDTRGTLMQGNLHAGIAFSNASLGLVHATAHAVGSATDAAHGLCVSAMLCPAIEFNYEAVPERCAALGGAIGARMTGHDVAADKDAFVSALEDLRRDVGVDTSLRELGVSEADVPDLVRAALRDPTLVTNPRAASAQDIEAVYERALRQ